MSKKENRMRGESFIGPIQRHTHYDLSAFSTHMNKIYFFYFLNILTIYSDRSTYIMLSRKRLR